MAFNVKHALAQEIGISKLMIVSVPLEIGTYLIAFNAQLILTGMVPHVFNVLALEYGTL